MLSYSSFEHQDRQGNTHIYAYGPRSYMRNTHVRLTSHKKGRHFGAKFTFYMIMNINIKMMILTSTLMDFVLTSVILMSNR